MWACGWLLTRFKLFSETLSNCSLIKDILGSNSNSNSNILIYKVIVIVIYYNDLGGISNSNSNILIFKVIVYYIDLGSSNRFLRIVIVIYYIAL